MDSKTGMYALDTGSLTAELIYDTQSQILPQGVRTLIERERRLFFAAAEYEVVLEVASDAPGGWSCVTGQVLAQGAPVSDVAVVLDDGTSQRTDANGSFRIVQLVTAGCGLHLRADAWELAWPPFALVGTLVETP
jgi:hypothetical protein